MIGGLLRVSSSNTPKGAVHNCLALRWVVLLHIRPQLLPADKRVHERANFFRFEPDLVRGVALSHSDGLVLQTVEVDRACKRYAELIIPCVSLPYGGTTVVDGAGVTQ